MGVDVEFSGMPELIEKLEATNGRFNTVENQALKAGAQPILEDMKNTTAFKDRTGRLRKSLKISGIKRTGGRKSVWVGDTDGKCNYSWFVEFGHSIGQSRKNMSAKDKRAGKLNKVTYAPARPFVAPALERHKREAIEIIKAELRQAIK